MNLDYRKIISDNDNLEFESFSNQVSIPHNIFPNLASSNSLSNGLISLAAPPMNTTPLIPIDIQQLIGDEKTDINIPSQENIEVLKQYNKNQKSQSKRTSSPVPLEGDIMPQDILKYYDLSLEINDDYLRKGASTKKINEVFNYLEDTDENIFKALNAYRVPLPISKAIIKKIINISIDYIDKE